MRPPCLQANERFNGLKPQKRAVRGKTMSLVLEDSNMALVNTTDTKPSAPGIFVIYDRFRLMVKSFKHTPTAATNTHDRQPILISFANTSHISLSTLGK